MFPEILRLVEKIKVFSTAHQMARTATLGQLLYSGKHTNHRAILGWVTSIHAAVCSEQALNHSSTGRSATKLRG